MTKKLSAIVLALVMMLSLSTVMVSAAGATVAIEIGKDVYKDDIFEASIVVNGLSTYAGAAVKVEFDATKLQVVKEDGTASKKWGEVTTTKAPEVMNEMDKLVDNTAGTIEYTVLPNAMHDDWDTEAPYVAGVEFPYSIIKIRFKAIATGAMGFAITKTDVYETPASKLTATDATVAANVLSMPTEPSVSALAIDGTVIEGATVKAAYTFNNGNTDEGADTTTGDASVVTWTIGEDTATGKELALTKEMVGKEIKFSVEPKVDRELKPTGAKAELAAAVMVKAKADYVPTATATLPAELIATIDYEPTVELDNTYALAEDASTYAWYVVEASETVNSVEAALAAELGEAVASTKATSFGADLRDNYAVVVVTPVVKVAGDTFTGTAVKAAALIKGEPPVVDASAVKTDKELNVSKAIKVVEGKDFTALSKAPEGTAQTLDISYAWYLATVDEVAEFDPEGKTGVSTTNSYKPVKGDLGKFVILYITATDALGISTTVEVKYDLAIAKATGGAPAADNGASLTTGGAEEEEPEVPGTEDPEGEEPKVEVEDPKGTANDKGAAAFTDVDKEAYAWAYDSIDALAKAGVIKGMSETTFEPEATATNAQVIALAVRIAGLTAEGATTDKVDAEHWVAAELAVADAKGILGVFGDKIATEEATTREAAFTLLYNALKAAGVELPETAEAIEYSDAASIDAACVEAITALTKAGIVNGMGDGTLAPKATITRAQLAKILGMADALIK